MAGMQDAPCAYFPIVNIFINIDYDDNDKGDNYITSPILITMVFGEC